jgi:hypothetical protein
VRLAWHPRDAQNGQLRWVREQLEAIAHQPVA